MVHGSSDDELPLPTASKHVAGASSSTSLRKRSRGSHASTNSSDPPCFSSDDLAEASVDNYAFPRRKKQHKRSWWEEEGATPIRHKALKRASQRAKDSGVFMSSDSSHSSLDDGFSVEPMKAKAAQSSASNFAVPRTPERKPARKAIVTTEDIARAVISKCLEDDKETVDLSSVESQSQSLAKANPRRNLQLENLSGDTLKPLETMISRPKVYSQKAEELFESLKPAIELYLASNLLTRLPNQIVDLTYLRVLSLRNNKLTELPHSIGKLQRLVELNLSGNNLRWLPYELLHLLPAGIHNLHVLPNPLFEPFPSLPGHWIAQSTVEHARVAIEHMSAALADANLDTGAPMDPNSVRAVWLFRIQEVLYERMIGLLHGDAEEYENMRWSTDGRTRYSHHYPWKCQPIYLASTPVTYFDFDGTAPRSAHPAPSAMPTEVRQLPPAWKPTTRHPQSCKASPVGGVPSLFEYALRSASENVPFTELEKYLGPEVPDTVTRGLRVAQDATEQGGTDCSVCDQNYILPRAEWIEYWHCSPDNLQTSNQEMFLPFLRRACSWACADRLLEEGETGNKGWRLSDGRHKEPSTSGTHYKYWSC